MSADVTKELHNGTPTAPNPVAVDNPTAPAAQTEELMEKPELPTWRLVFVIISICIGLFLSLLDTTIVATALYTIGVDLHSLEIINWIALAYTLSYLGCVVIFARISDIIGRKNAQIAAFTIFVAFSIGCGFAQNIHQLIACRVIKGVGGSGLYSLTFVIMPEVAPAKVQRWTAALAGAVVAVAGVMGPVIGGIITSYTTWRWIFWLNAPIGIFALVMFVIAWPKPHQLRPIEQRSPRELDYVGCLLIIAASLLTVFAFQEAGTTTHAWNKPIFIVPLIFGCISWPLLFSWEIFAEKRRGGRILSVFPTSLIYNRVYMGNAIVTLLSGFPYFVVVFALPTRFQVLNDKTPLMSGVGLLPLLGSVAVGSTLSGALNGGRNNSFETLLAGSIFSVIGTAALSTVANQVKVPAALYGFQVFVGLGFGLTVSTSSLAAVIESEIRDSTAAQGIIAQMRVLGGSIGIAASTAILAAFSRHDLSDTGLITFDQLSNLSDLSKSLTPEQLAAVRKVYHESFNQEVKVCAAIAGASVLATLLTYRKNPMRVEQRRIQQLLDEQKRLRGLREAEAAAEEK